MTSQPGKFALLMGILAFHATVYAQTAMPTQSFVFNMKPSVTEGNSALNTIVDTVEKGDSTVTCATLTRFMADFGISFNSPTRGYVVHVFKFQDDDESEQSHVWYSFDTAWYDKTKGCNIGLFKKLEGFSPIQAITDPTAGWFRGSQSFRDQRLWGTTDVATLTVLDTRASDMIDKLFKANDKAIQQSLQDYLLAPTKDDAKTNLQARTETVCASAKKSLPSTSDLFKACTPAKPDFSTLTSPPVADLIALIEKTYAAGTPGGFQIQTTLNGQPVTWTPVSYCPTPQTPCAATQIRLVPSALASVYQSKLKYQWDVTKTTPQPVQNLQIALSQGAAAANGSETTIPLNLEIGTPVRIYIYASEAKPITLVPSSIKVTGTLTAPAKSSGGSDSSTALGSTTYVNEGRYWWNVSVAAPLKSVKTLTYNTGSLSPQSLDNKAGYAAFDVYLHKVDVTNTSLRLIPAFFGGPSFTGKFLDRWMVGVSIGAWYVEPFWGYSFLGANVPVNPADTTNKATYRQWTHAPVWGINIPIRSFYKLSTNNSSKTSSSTAKSN